MNVDREKLIEMLGKYAAAREAAAVEEERAKKYREIAWDVYHELCVYLDECTAKTERAEVVPLHPQVPCSVCKYWYIGHCNLKDVDIDGTHPHCDKLEFPIPKAETPTEDVPEVSCLECKHAERVSDDVNTWKCTLGAGFAGYAKVECNRFEAR